MASDFNINVNDLSDSQSITSRIKESFYPDNTQVVKGTSYSQSGEYGRSLMARDPAKVLQGDGLYRNPAFVMAGYEQNVQSSLHAVLAMGADIGDTVKVPDPDNPDGPPLTGAQARLEIARKSVMSTGLELGGLMTLMQRLQQSGQVQLRALTLQLVVVVKVLVLLQAQVEKLITAKNIKRHQTHKFLIIKIEQ